MHTQPSGKCGAENSSELAAKKTLQHKTDLRGPVNHRAGCKQPSGGILQFWGTKSVNLALLGS